MSQQINLLRPKTRVMGTAIATAACVGGVVLAMLAYQQHLLAQNERLQQTASADAKKIGELKIAIAATQQRKDAQGDAAALSAEVTALRPRAAAMDQLLKDVRSGALGSQDGFGAYFRTLASVSEEDLWITGVAVTQGGSVVSISGRALHNEANMRYAQRLNAAFSSHGIAFKSLELTPESAPKPGTVRAPSLTTVAFKLS